MVNQQESICGHWIKRVRKEQLFESNWLNKLDNYHKTLHEIANDLYNKYQHGDLDAAKEGLKEIRTTFNKLNNILAKSK